MDPEGEVAIGHEITTTPIQPPSAQEGIKLTWGGLWPLHSKCRLGRLGIRLTPRIQTQEQWLLLEHICIDRHRQFGGNRSRVHDPEQVQTLRQFGIRLGNGHHIEELLNLGQDLPARPHLHCLLVESWRHIKRGDQADSGASQPANRNDRPHHFVFQEPFLRWVQIRDNTLFIDAVDRNQTKSQFATCAIDLNSRKLRGSGHIFRFGKRLGIEHSERELAIGGLDHLLKELFNALAIRAEVGEVLCTLF